MKLVIAIVQDKDSDQLSNQFIEHDVRATKFASSGSFLRSGNSTFLIGIDDQRVDEVLEIIKHVSKKRQKFITPPVGVDTHVEGVHNNYPRQVSIGGATVFVLDVAQFEQY